jgi:CBS domain-containing protein
MMALFGAISRAPLANILMVAEMTGNISVAGPALVAVAIAAFIVHRFDDSIYRSQLRTRADSQASRMRAGLTMIHVLPVSTAAVPAPVLLRSGQTARDALIALRAARVASAPVTDAEGTYLGTIAGYRLGQVSEEHPDAVLRDYVDPSTGTVHAEADLAEAIDALTQAGGQWVTVTDDQRRVTGIVTAGAIVHAYRNAVREPGPVSGKPRPLLRRQ